MPHIGWHLIDAENEIPFAIALNKPKLLVLKPIGDSSRVTTIASIIAHRHAPEQASEVGEEIFRFPAAKLSAQEIRIQQHSIRKRHSKRQGCKIYVKDDTARTLAHQPAVCALDEGKPVFHDQINSFIGVETFEGNSSQSCFSA